MGVKFCKITKTKIKLFYQQKKRLFQMGVVELDCKMQGRDIRKKKNPG